MVSNRNSEGVLDPKMSERPSSRALKRTLLVALRCVDPDSLKRPKMGQVIHMLEVDDFPYRDVSTSSPLVLSLSLSTCMTQASASDYPGAENRARASRGGAGQPDREGEALGEAAHRGRQRRQRRLRERRQVA